MDEHPQQTFKEERRSLRWIIRLFVIIALAIVLGIFLHVGLVTAPTAQHTDTIVIKEGSSVREIASLLDRSDVVRSEAVLYAVLRFQYKDATVQAGEYTFKRGSTVFEVAEFLIHNTPQEDNIPVTLLEGTTVATMASSLAAEHPNIDPEVYIAEAAEIEGFLFPETYFIPESYTADDVIELQTTTYGSTLEQIDTTNTTLTEYEAVIIASILEREANSPQSMGIVSGILQNRLTLGMPLQADATIEYVLDTPLGELRPGELAENLRDLDSPYNTYKNTGLPPTPIGNPGKTALTAAYNPTATDYLFYITDDAGEFHYANSYAKHRQNIEIYLR